MKNSLLIPIALIMGAGCASYPPPTDHLASAIAATRGAQEGGAPRVPSAALHLKLAQEEVEQARAMIENDQNERADFMTLRAYNDAELALALARADAARLRAERAQTLASSAEQPREQPRP